MEETPRMIRENKKRRPRIITVVPVLVILLGAFAFFVFKPSPGPVPDNIANGVNFTIYYPKELPEGYSLRRDSVKLDEEVLFMTFVKDSESVTISQVRTPDYDPGLTWAGFEELKIPIGRAYVGRNGGRAVALISAKDTLINVAANPDVPDQVVSSIANSLRTLSH